MAELSMVMKIWGDISNLTKSLTKGKEEVKSFGRGTDATFSDLAKSVKISEDRFKKFAVQMGVNSKEAKTALAEYHKLKGELNNINNALRPQKQQSMFSGMANELKGTITGFMGVTAAIGLATGALTAMVTGAMEDERAEKRLGAALDGNAESIKRMLSWKERMMSSTLFSEEEIMSAATMGLELGRTESQTKKLVETAMGLSRATGQDLNSAMLALSATYEGNVGKLGKLAGEVKGLTEEQLKNGDAVDILNQKYGKLASEGINTAEGEFIQAKKNIQELGDSIGSWLITNIGQAIPAIKAFWMAMGGDPSVALARAKASATQSALMEAHEKKMDEIRANAEKRANPMLDRLKKQIELEERAAEAAKATAAAKEQELAAWGKYLNFMAQGGMGPVQPNTMGEATGNGSIQRATTIQPKTVTGPVTQGLTGIAGPDNELERWSKAIDEVASKARGLDSVWQNVFTSFSTLVAKAATNFKDGWKDAMGAVGDTLSTGIAAISQLFGQANEKHLEELDQYYTTERESIEGSRMSQKQKAKAIEKLDAETAAKKRALMREQAKQQKTVSLMQAIVSGALAIVQAFASGPGIGIVLGLLMTGLVAAQIAAIASQPLPALAEGGLATAPTLALVGDNPNARIDPEVISPLSKLKELIGTSDQTGTLTARVSGDDLLFIMQRAERSKARRY
jgi:hypothetical protein